MCKIYASTPVHLYATETRSVRLNGYATSVRLERRFWSILEEIARGETQSVGQFLSTLHSEAVESHGDIDNFASLLRVVCTVYLDQDRSAALALRTAA